MIEIIKNYKMICKRKREACLYFYWDFCVGLIFISLYVDQDI